MGNRAVNLQRRTDAKTPAVSSAGAVPTHFESFG